MNSYDVHFNLATESYYHPAPPVHTSEVAPLRLSRSVHLAGEPVAAFVGAVLVQESSSPSEDLLAANSSSRCRFAVLGTVLRWALSWCRM